MKKLYKIIVSLLVVIVAFSCSDDDKFILEQPEASFLIEVPNSGSNIVLNRANPDNQALTVTWADSQNTGASYSIEFAESATDFAESFIAGTSDSDNFTLSVEALNTFLVNAVKIPQAVSSVIDVRVVASNGDVSNTVSLSITPFVIEVAELFVNGSFTNWDPAQGLPMNSSEFNNFSINIDLMDGDEFNFIPSNTSDEVVWQLVETGSSDLTKFGGLNLSGYPEGNYDITVDLNTNTFTIDEVIIPVNLFLVGSLTAWDATASLPFNLISEGVFTIVVALADGDQFKFIPTNIDFSDDWGEDPGNPGSIIQDGEQNVSGYPTGTYQITVDFNTLTFTLVELVQSPRIAVPGNHQGWDPPSAPQLEASSLSTTDYEGYVWLDGQHKFVGPDGNGDFNWGNTDWGDASGVDGSFTQILAVDGEGNIENPSGPGHYFITADTGALTYSEIKYDWAVTGDATPLGWPPSPDGTPGEDQDMTYDPDTDTWTITLDLVAGQMKFRANDAWAWNYGDTGADGSLENGGGDIIIATDGNYTVVLDLSTPRAYTYSVTLN
ncbi:SusE domain-containing protein [Changchengzhania lutea]|uniref:SusE domain-containing protein n=1 Tax=Changchengzhania lutea TaxID=2049305 RepID=UPI00115DA0DA|nr:SusE domain-containing protein [Changchengzhania lutea]